MEVYQGLWLYYFVAGVGNPAKINIARGGVSKGIPHGGIYDIKSYEWIGTC